MDFTREPIIETIITPKEGYKLVVRTSKGTAQEEYFVEAVEVVSFGHAQFFRSLERPKSFIVPVSDYEVLEVREPRMVLKNAGLDRSIKIGGGREGSLKVSGREPEKTIQVDLEQESHASKHIHVKPLDNESLTEAKPDVRVDKKRDRRKNYRKRRGSKGDERDETRAEGEIEPNIPQLEDEQINLPPPEEGIEAGSYTPLSSSILSSLLQPPPMLISETINRYRENALFKSAFFLSEEDDYKPHDKVQDLLDENDDEDYAPALQEPTFVKEHEEESSDEVQLEPGTEVLHQHEIHEGNQDEHEELQEEKQDEIAEGSDDDSFKLEEEGTEFELNPVELIEELEKKPSFFEEPDQPEEAVQPAEKHEEFENPAH
ncbi:MAG: hypothetical protein H0V82_11860 [Candidatus Protochlamydia sp.]|nr:hypothetical protein [Candidatus Protochlamydia sp.]